MILKEILKDVSNMDSILCLNCSQDKKKLKLGGYNVKKNLERIKRK